MEKYFIYGKDWNDEDKVSVSTPSAEDPYWEIRIVKYFPRKKEGGVRVHGEKTTTIKTSNTTVIYENGKIVEIRVL